MTQGIIPDNSIHSDQLATRKGANQPLRGQSSRIQDYLTN